MKAIPCPRALTDGSVSGVIVLNIYSKPLLQLLAALPLPKVFLDTVPGVGQPELGGDLLLLGGPRFGAADHRPAAGPGLPAAELLSADVGYAQTNADRYKGFLDAHRSRGLTPCKDLCLTGPFGLYTPLRGDQPLFWTACPCCRTAMCAPATTSPITSSSITTTAALQRERRGAVDRLLTTTPSMPTWPTASPTVDTQTPTIGARLASRILFRLSHPDCRLRGQLHLHPA